MGGSCNRPIISSNLSILLSHHGQISRDHLELIITLHTSCLPGRNACCLLHWLGMTRVAETDIYYPLEIGITSDNVILVLRSAPDPVSSSKPEIII